jgi:hypothetical protein
MVTLNAMQLKKVGVISPEHDVVVPNHVTKIKKNTKTVITAVYD